MSGYYSVAETRRIEAGGSAVMAYEPPNKRARGPNTELGLIGGSVNRAMQISVSLKYGWGGVHLNIGFFRCTFCNPKQVIFCRSS